MTNSFPLRVKNEIERKYNTAGNKLYLRHDETMDDTGETIDYIIGNQLLFDRVLFIVIN